jgi:hypothetical protein
LREHQPTEWVVYRANIKGNLSGQNAICSQQEWEAMESASPGLHTLIREHIPNESAAEQLARSLQTPAAPPPPRKRPVKPVATGDGVPVEPPTP